MLATGLLLKNCELVETYDRVTISSVQAIFLTVSMATFCNNKQALYMAFFKNVYNFQFTAKQHH